MGTYIGLRRRVFTAYLIFLYLTGETESAARFLSHVPQDYHFQGSITRESPDYDSDVNLPGRHYPKLPYQNPYLENEQDDFRESINHQSNYHNNHNLHQQNSYDKKEHQPSRNYYPGQSYGPEGRHVEPILAYGVRREPGGSTFSRQSYLSSSTKLEQPDYLDDTGEVTADLKNRGHPIRGLYGGKIAPIPTTTLPPSPSFARDTRRTFSVESGKTAKLICKVLNVGDKLVSWMRHEDLHILTVGKYKYSTDKRVSVIFNEAEQEWILQIQSVRMEDEGLYECQVSTIPVLSYIVSMNVIVPSAMIVSGPEIFVHRGSLINLTCIVDHSVERPRFIYWYHYDKLIDYGKDGAVVNLDKTGPSTMSNLLLRDASKTDSGKYTCKPSDGEDASVMLHVLDGENQAAMQTNTSGRLMTSVAVTMGAISLCISVAIVMCGC